jgi:2-polyprenyl-3-methyl-5-hydroxy-6-metoxy-1,4-benzoquinol methylase
MIKDKTAICPVCKSSHVDKLFETDSLAVVRHLLNAGKMAVKEQCKQKIETLWESNNAAFYVCRDCTFEFAHPFIAGDADFYSFVYDVESNYPADKWEYSVTFESIIRFLNNSSMHPRLLEIGAGNGSFLKMLAGKIIPVNEIFATEYSETGAKSIGILGITCLQKDLHHLTEEDLSGKISIVCMFQVLEHLTDINEVFEKLSELTFPGSRMYISVPNNLQRRFFDNFGLHYDLPPVHVGRYNLNSLNRLANIQGWQVLRHLIQPSAYIERILKFIYSEYSKGQLVFNPETVKLKFIRIFLRYSMLAILMILHIRILIGLRNPKLGTSQWFELERFNNYQ